MGTRSVVAVPLDGGFQGRYIHWDGYPTGVGADLHALVNRDGVETVLRVMTQENYGWSNTDLSHDGVTLGHGYDDGRFRAVKGYGVAYTTEQNQSNPDEWIRSSGDCWGTEWAYVLGRDSIAVFQPRGSWANPDWVHVGTVRYDEDPSAFQRIEQEVYAAAE